MRLLLIANDFPNPYEPNRSVFNLRLVRALAQRHEVRVISPISWVDELRALGRGTRCLHGGRCAVVHGIEAQYPRYYYPPRVLRSSYGWFYWQSIRRTVRQILHQGRPDAVLGYWIHPDGQAAVRAAQLAGVPAGVIVGGSDLLLLPRSSGRRRRVLAVLRGADCVLTVSRHLREKVVDFGIAPEKVHIWHQGIEKDRFYPGDRRQARIKLGLSVDARALLWVGRLVHVKGVDVLLQACASLRGRLAVHLYLVGDGPLRAALQAQAAKLGLGGTVSFLGSRPGNELPDWYRAADLTVLPSRSEGLPNVLRESLACGTPFVASRVGGISEIAQEPWDQLVPCEDQAALTAAIHRALQQPPSGVRPRFRSPSWEESAETLLSLLVPEALTDPVSVRRASQSVGSRPQIAPTLE
jgi:glycosyltransferase involved in cell wall biosynthesis